MSFDVKTSNQFTTYSDTLSIYIKTIEDLYPQIAIVEHKDTIFPDRILFRGQIKDDYGFSMLTFCINHVRGNDTIKKTSAIEVNKNDNAQDFYYNYDLTNLSVSKGDKLEYYFEVKDNDAINGGKITKSKIFSLNLPTEEELEAKKEGNSQNIKESTKDALAKIKDLKDQINEISKQLINKQNLTWQDKEQIKDLLKKQEDIKKEIEEIKQSLEENNLLEEKLTEQEEEILKKQKELEELFDKVLNQQMKDILEEMKKLAEEQVDKNKLNET